MRLTNLLRVTRNRPAGLVASLLQRAGARRSVWAALALTGAVGLALPSIGLAQATRPATAQPGLAEPELQREYQSRFDRLAANDVQGHFALAEWCRDRGLYRLLFRQSGYVLRLDSQHEQARELYRLASEHLRQNAAAASRPAESEPAAASDGEFLAPAQIQKLKWAEFLSPEEVAAVATTEGRGRARAGEEFLKVRFGERVLNDFVDSMSGQQDFDSLAERRRFLQLPPTLQVQLIRQFSGAAFQNRIEIVNDPFVFRQFQQVLPVVMGGCGTMACHGSADAPKWRLCTARPRTDANLYTNWLIVNRVSHGTMPLVNRSNPPMSLLLQYGLPLNQAVHHHPKQIPVVLPQRNDDVRYRTILDWIDALRIPTPRTGVALSGYPEPPPPQIGGNSGESDSPPAASADK